MRSGAVVAAFIVCYMLWSQSILLAIGSFIVFIALFFRLVVLDLNNKARIRNVNTLIDINGEEIKIATHQFTHRDDGSRFLPVTHAYASDLDIFGRASLYQYINRTTSEQGSALLSKWLLEPTDEKELLTRQEAVKELTDKIEWRQQLQAYGIKEPLMIETEQRIETWLNEENTFISKTHWKIIRYLFPALSLLSLLLWTIGTIPGPIFSGIAFIFFLISGQVSKKIHPLYTILGKIAPKVETLHDGIHWVETVPFKAEMLKRLQQQLLVDRQPASCAIKQLNKILERFDVRLNMAVFIALNTFLFWDLQQAFALEEWRNKNRNKVPLWFNTLATFESLNTLGCLAFNHPDWCFPVFTQQPGTLITGDLGHPLIESSKRVTSSFSTSDLRQLALITGSNMAGKSTFLRSIGVNMILAVMGAPVCASTFTVWPMKIMSSMRIADNLEESTSTFYAELKKLKDIIDAVNRKERIFILLDEILRGTNSLDRHTGSKALIKQLLSHEALGMIATHDLELAKLADAFPGHIHNYHFDVQVANDELFFDYKLKHGICQSLNASILMKKIGIEL